MDKKRLFNLLINSRNIDDLILGKGVKIKTKEELSTTKFRVVITDITPSWKRALLKIPGIKNKIKYESIMSINISQ